MTLSNFAWFIDLFMTSFNQRYSLRYHSYIVLFAYFSTFDGYFLIIQIINQIPFIYYAIYAKFSVYMVNPYGGQYIVLSPIEMHLFNHHVKALLLANIVYFYIRDVYVILVISTNWNYWEHLYYVYFYIFIQNVKCDWL